MTIDHESYTLQRRIAACPAHVFACWSDQALKRRWFVESDGPQWRTLNYTLDFRIGGGERGRFVLNEGAGAGRHESVTHFLDIVPERRIVFAYTMALNGRVHSASLATVSFEEAQGGTLLTFTEQGAFFAPSDGAKMREGGWTHLLDALKRTLKETAHA